MHRYEEEEIRSLGRGRSEKKREAKVIEELAQRLTEITASALGKLPKSPELSKEIELARNTKGNSSRKRQIKHLAGMLRGHEEQRLAIEAALDGQSVSQRQEALAFHHLEELRDRLCATETYEAALKEVRTTYPYLDAGKLARLSRSVREHSDKKAAREIFRRLRKAEESNDV